MSLTRLRHFCARGLQVVRRNPNTYSIRARYLASVSWWKKKIPPYKYRKCGAVGGQFGWVTVALHGQHLVGLAESRLMACSIAIEGNRKTDHSKLEFNGVIHSHGDSSTKCKMCGRCRNLGKGAVNALPLGPDVDGSAPCRARPLSINRGAVHHSCHSGPTLLP